jgi:predicted outer membrane repeat protein
MVAEFLFSQGTLSNVQINLVSSPKTLSLRNSKFSIINNLSMTNLNNSEAASFVMVDSEINEINGLIIQNVSEGWIQISRSTISLINNATLSDSKQGIYLIDSTISSLNGSVISNNDNPISLYAGGINAFSSNISLGNTTFISNKGGKGGAVQINCDSKKKWEASINSCIFNNNSASEFGGAIYYNLYRPTFSNNIYSGNSAPYGNNVASYPVKIVFTSTNSTNLVLNNVPSGLLYAQDLDIKLVDYDEQIMNLENDRVVKLATITEGAKISGNDYAKLEEGQAKITNLIFTHSPGAQNIEYNLLSKVLDKEQIKVGLSLDEEEYQHYLTKVYVNFRFCKPGEIIFDNGTACTEWSYRTYSFGWNSTQCLDWMDRAVWNGTTQILVEPNYWRRDSNSSTIVECPRKEAWLGGYSLENEHPVNCKKGYGGYLWTEWQIVDGVKYQALSNFNWAKCPNQVLNALRIVGVILIILLFLALIIIVNIRKKTENQFSILMRIFTNYLQLISVTLSFSSSIPGNFTSIFSQTDKFVSPSETFLSFDCFIENYEIKEFAPSNKIFKLFLFMFLPLFLIVGVAILCFVLKPIVKKIKPNIDYDTKRYIVVSVISIIFLLHPNLTLESLSMFQWIKVDEGHHRMKMHMEYEWFSKEHIFWACLIGLPILLIWAIMMPAIALAILIKNRTILGRALYC